MSLVSHDNLRRIVFVSRDFTGESVLSARAILKLDGLHLFAICERVPDSNAGQILADWVQIADVHNSEQLVLAAVGLARKHGPLDKIVTTRETLLEPVARAAELLGLKGMSVSTIRRVLDKSSLKTILGRVGLKTARDQVLASHDDAIRFVGEIGFPIVLKPLNGSGGLATWCIRNSEQLELALELTQPSLGSGLLAEDYLRGQELCIDTITIANEPQFYSICCYRPSIMEALENPRIQWTCVMPRDISGRQYHDFIEQGLTAVRALSVGNAMTHMEGFLLAEGGVSFTDATIRPAGARIAPMLAFAYDIDPYLAWARVAVDGCFDGPWERRYAVGTIFLRGTGSGVIDGVHGVESLKRDLGELLMDIHLPRIGAAKSITYTGDGYVTVRHEETKPVEDALDFIARTVCITYSEPQPVMPPDTRQQWGERLQYFNKQLNRPAWDHDVLQAI